MAKCRQARMKIARHGAAAECRVGKKDDLSPALAGRLNRICDIGFHFYSRIPRGSQTSLSQTVTFKTIPVQAQLMIRLHPLHAYNATTFRRGTPPIWIAAGPRGVKRHRVVSGVDNRKGNA